MTLFNFDRNNRMSWIWLWDNTGRKKVGSWLSGRILGCYLSASASVEPEPELSFKLRYQPRKP
jgi:hypothetical protein